MTTGRLERWRFSLRFDFCFFTLIKQMLVNNKKAGFCFFCTSGSAWRAAGGSERQIHHQQGHIHPEISTGEKAKVRDGIKSISVQIMRRILGNTEICTFRNSFLKARRSAVLIQKMWRGYNCRRNYRQVTATLLAGSVRSDHPDQMFDPVSLLCRCAQVSWDCRCSGGPGSIAWLTVGPGCVSYCSRDDVEAS